MPRNALISDYADELWYNQAAFLRQTPETRAAILEARSDPDDPFGPLMDRPGTIENPDIEWTIGPYNEPRDRNIAVDVNQDDGSHQIVTGAETRYERPSRYERPPIQTDYLGGAGIELGGIEDPRFDLSGGPGWDQTAPPGPPGGWDSPPPGYISGPSREFSPHGETIGQFSAPRTYGGLPRSTGPWGAAGGWYNQAALAAALRGQ